MPLDLNLLTALDALLEEGSVAGAAHRLVEQAQGLLAPPRPGQTLVPVGK